MTAQAPRIAVVKRGAQVAATLGPLVPAAVSMGAEPGRRHDVGERFGRSALALGGAFPWIAAMLAEIPTLGGREFSNGVAAATKREGRRDTFFETEVVEHGRAMFLSQRAATLVAADLSVSELVLRMLSPFVGALSDHLVRALTDLLTRQLDAETSISEEISWRARVGTSGAVRAIAIAPGSSRARLVERVSTPYPARLLDAAADDLRPAYSHLISWWADAGTASAFLPSALSWRNVHVGADGELVIRRLAGSVELDAAHQEVVEALVAGSDPKGSVLQMIVAELGCTPERGRPFEELIKHLAWENTPHPGARQMLSSLDRAVSDDAGPSRISAQSFVLIRQLLLFRTMADDIGLEAPPFGPRWTGSHQR
jgi:hypothetical protein